MSAFPHAVIVSNIEILKREGHTQWDPMGPNGSLTKLHCFQNSPSSSCWLQDALQTDVANVINDLYHLSSPVHPPQPPGGIWKVESTTSCGRQRGACCPPPQHHPLFLVGFSFSIPFTRSSSLSHVQKFWGMSYPMRHICQVSNLI